MHVEIHNRHHYIDVAVTSQISLVRLYFVTKDYVWNSFSSVMLENLE